MQTAQGVGTPKTSSGVERAGIGWRELLFWLAAVQAAALVVGTIALGEIIPPLIAFALLFVVGAALARRSGRAGPILIGALSVVLVALNIPFVVAAATVPASTPDFMLATVPSALALASVVALVGALRRPGPAGTAPRIVGLTCALAIVVLGGVAAVARIAYESPIAADGDVTLTAQDLGFAPGTLTAGNGEVTVFVENRDSTLHSFTIEELGVDLRIPGNADGRVTFDAGPGSYEFVCTPHEGLGMTGTLEVQ